MQQLSENVSLSSTLLALHYFRVQLVRGPEPDDPSGPNAPLTLAAECEAHEAQIKDADANCENVSIERMTINAHLQRTTNKNYKLILQLAREVRSKVQGDQSNPLYLRIFPKSPSEGAGHSSSYLNIMRYTKNISQILEAYPNDYEEYQSYITPLQNNVEEIDQLIRKREQFIIDEQKLNLARKLKLQEAQEFYNHAYVRLLMAYNGDKNLVEAFFHKVSGKGKKKKSEDKGEEEEKG